MIPFTSPEIQFDLIRERNEELVREADLYRLARGGAHRRRWRWPLVRRPAQSAQSAPPAQPTRSARQSLAS
ncbi:hypothetical protein AB0M02_16930 [Actinoplanes sp. NPDC051861]|uniref:hypothetical protein n=1 Tax=Actinoplanes sp. NPDC051861 TaxID=3155170 RepID=UPI00343C9187